MWREKEWDMIYVFNRVLSSYCKEKVQEVQKTKDVKDQEDKLSMNN